MQSTGDIYGKERLNSALNKHEEILRRHIKLWVASAGVLDSIINAGTHVVSREEVERTIAAAKIYVRNSSFDEALAILKEHRVCIISGLPGIGKTTLARMLLLYFYERKFDVVKIESDISEARTVGYHKKPRFYYYDDFLGQTAQADKLNKNEDQKLLDFMASVRDSKDSVFVLTTREYILNQAKLHYEKLATERFDHRTCIIDLAKYSRRIRAQILYNHLHFSNLPRPHLESLVAKRGYIQIVDHKNYNPRLIEYLTDLAWIGETPSDDYLTLFLRNLDNPVAIWEHAFRNQLSERARHLLFVLTTMPQESKIGDVEKSFVAFHDAQSLRFGTARSATDFKSALKELDGTFVATRKVQDFVLVRFQNPSIRDFMQNLLLGGELLPEIIASLVFFEQAQWFMETLIDEAPQVSIKELLRHKSTILDSLKKLIGEASCLINVRGTQEYQTITLQRPNPAVRLAGVVAAVFSQKGRDDGEWIATKLLELANELETRSLSPSFCLGSTQTLESLGCLATDAGKRLVSALKQQAMSQTDDLNDYETLANLVDVLPQTFSEIELGSIRTSYLEFVEGYPADCESFSPDELREEAARVGNVGDLLQVDTDGAQGVLRESADEIEKEQESSGPDYDDEWRDGGTAEVCSDGELHSLFGTLGR